MNAIELAERGWIPDWLVRVGIRRLLTQRLKQQRSRESAINAQSVNAIVDELRHSPLAVNTDDANDQHYEVPAEFFEIVLGPHVKYSCCHYSKSTVTLADAEQEMLALTCERAQIEDGMEILELGCGWGSLTLWMAQQFPNSQITAVSNSNGQRQFIERQCRDRGIECVRIITTDMRDFEIDDRFDRVVSVEMFEHMRNYELLMRRISNWLKPAGKLFVHIFCHRELSYLFETEGTSNWMGRHFFTGGIMPADDLLLKFQDDVTIEERWRENGMNYAHTCEAWLRRLDENRSQVNSIFESLIEKREARIAVQRWRMFFMACAELFKYGDGNEWYVAHYLFKNQPATNEVSKNASDPMIEESTVSV